MQTLQPDSFHHVQRAWAAYEAKHYDLAEREARGALAMEPNNAEALSVLSLCSMQRNDRPEAVQLAEKCISHAPDEAIYHYRLALIHGHFADHKAAEPPLRVTLELDPAFGPAFSLYAWVYFARGHYDIALSGIDEALKFDPFDTYALNLRVKVLRSKGDRSGALRAAEQVLRIDPENHAAHSAVGALQLELKNRGSAIAHLKESLRLEPDAEWVRQAYSQALEGRALPARLLMQLCHWTQTMIVECSFIVPVFFLGYVRCRQGLGVPTDWHPILLALVIAGHLVVVTAWWGPLFSYFAIPRDSDDRRQILAGHGLRERTRVASVWQFFVSVTILASASSIVVAGDWIAPFACVTGAVALAMLACALANSPSSRFASRACAIAVCILSVAWFFDPAALQSERRTTQKPLSKFFPVAVILSAVIIPVFNEPRGKWLSKSST